MLRSGGGGRVRGGRRCWGGMSGLGEGVGRMGSLRF